MRKALLAALLLFLPLSLAEASQPVGLGYSPGYGSFWFSPSVDSVAMVRVDNLILAPFYTARIGDSHYFRASASREGADSGLFFMQWGWDLTDDAAAFLGPSVRILKDGSIEGFGGDSFTVGLSGSVDFKITLSETRSSEVVSAFFGLEHTTRRLTHLASGRTMHGFSVALGVNVSSVLFEKK